MEEAELVERARSGDVGAYEQLVLRYQDLAVRTAYVIAGAADAEDAAQEAFVKAYYSLSGFRSGASFRPWLLRIVANEAINRRRADRRKGNLALRLAEGLPSEDAVPSAEGTALAHEQRRELVEGLNRLREGDRLVIAFRYFMDLSESEIAQALNCPAGTVKSRLSRAMSRLRAALAELDRERSKVGGGTGVGR